MVTDYADYVSSISFRFIKPHTALPIPNRSLREGLKTARERGASGWLARLGTWVEFINTEIPDDGREMKRNLRQICSIPRMSTLAIGAMINKGVAQMPQDEVFVNVGVWHGFTFLAALVGNSAKKCVGVDNFRTFGGPREYFLDRFSRYRSLNHLFYEMDYVDYFATIHKDAIGFYLYDGNHDYNNQLRGLQAAEPFFADDCIVMIDDTNWDTPRRAVMDFISHSRHEYRIVLDRRTSNNCHPTLWNGVIIIQRSK